MKMIVEINRFNDLTEAKQKECTIQFCYRLHVVPSRSKNMYRILSIGNPIISIHQKDDLMTFSLSKRSVPIIKLLIKNYL